MKTLIPVLLIGFAAGAAFAEPELKGTPSELADYLAALPKTVNISAESEVKVQADRAYVKVKVSTEGRSLQEALNRNAALRQQISDELKKSGVPEQSISGSKFSSQPEYGMFSDKAKSYKIENTVRVMIADEAQFRLVAASIDAHAEASYDGVDFEDSKESENRQKAVAQACEAVTKKKQLYEDKLGVKLTPQSFSDNDMDPQPPVPLPMMCAATAGIGSDRSMKAQTYIAPEAPGVSQFGEIVYRAMVLVRYELKQP